MHFVLSTVVETLQPVLAPLSAAQKSQECSQDSRCWTHPQVCLPMLSRTPPVCGNGYHGGMAFGTKLAHWKPKVSQLFKRGGHVCFFLSSCMIQSFLRPIQGLGAKVKVIHANQREWYGCKGWCPDCQEHLTLTYKRSKVSRSLSGCHMNYFLCCWKRFPAVEAYIIFTTWMLWTLIAFLLFCTGSYPRNSVRPWPVGWRGALQNSPRHQSHTATLRMPPKRQQWLVVAWPRERATKACHSFCSKL